MKPWMKVALGCLAASMIAAFLFVAGLVGLGYWAKNKIEEVAGGGPVVEEARKTANAVPFTRPTNGVIEEMRLNRFIDVRASVYTVYEKYKGEIESRMAKVKEGQSIDFSDISTGLTFIGELQKAEALALAKFQMSENEYGFISGEVYKSMWTDMGGAEGTKNAIKEASEAAKAATDAMKKAEGLPPEAREALTAASEEMVSGSRDAARQMDDLVTHPENVKLFKKYEADLKKYAMPALEALFNPEAEGTPKPMPVASPKD